MKIRYMDHQGFELPADKVPRAFRYSKQFWLNDVLQRQETYDYGNLWRVRILNQEGLSHEQILAAELMHRVPVFIRDVGVQGSFRYHKTFNYDRKGVLQTISTEVFDQHNNVIVSSFTDDIEQETPYWNGTSKWYYDPAIRADDDPLFWVQYDDDGTIYPVDVDVEELYLGDQDSIAVTADAEGVQSLMSIFGMSRQLAEFYLSDRILPDF